MNVVPFGKYRGQPIEVLQADTAYLEWCQAQPSLVQKYASLFEAIRQMMGTVQDCTPEHNQLQARFLTDEKLVRFLLERVCGFVPEVELLRRASLEHRFPRATEKMKDQPLPFSMESIQLESPWQGRHLDVVIPYVRAEIREPAYGSDTYLDMVERNLVLELKPTVGDDYPKIMRTMLPKMCLFTQSYTGSVHVDHVREMFKRNGFHFVLETDQPQN